MVIPGWIRAPETGRFQELPSVPSARVVGTAEEGAEMSVGAPPREG